MSDARTRIADLTQRAAEAHAEIYRAAGCAVTVSAGRCVVDHGPRLAAGRVLGGQLSAGGRRAGDLTAAALALEPWSITCRNDHTGETYELEVHVHDKFLEVCGAGEGVCVPRSAVWMLSGTLRDIVREAWGDDFGPARLREALPVPDSQHREVTVDRIVPAAAQAEAAQPPLEQIWRHGHDRSWQRVSLRHYPRFVHIIAEQLSDGEVLGGTAIVPARALPALLAALQDRAEGVE